MAAPTDTTPYGSAAASPRESVGADPYDAPAAAPYVQPPIAVKKKRRKWPWVLGSIAVIIILIIVLFAVAINKAVKNLDTEQASHAITPAQFSAVQLGISHTALQSQLGKSPITRSS